MKHFFERLNPKQKEAVFHTEGALLIIAGAGSGKTSVLCCRIANIINEGLALPWQILAVTFTNKAAGELRERLSSMKIENAKDIHAGTFHSTCVRILRNGIEGLNTPEDLFQTSGIKSSAQPTFVMPLFGLPIASETLPVENLLNDGSTTVVSGGYRKGFTIYDTDDSLRLIKSCMKDLNISEKVYAPKSVFHSISRAKDFLVTPKFFEITNENGLRDSHLETAQRVYSLYQQRLKSANALDFNDLIMKTVELFEKNPDILSQWQKKFRYIMVDEYQDTNYAQYRLVSLLAGKNGNLCVVGDEDQSIYRFRGATIENILSFEEEFKAHTIKLEQNYRSTQNILGAANGVICKNTQRKPKKLYSTIDAGEKVQLHILANEHEEAMFISREIEKGKGNGISFGKNAVLYRTNAQSRTVELGLARASIPYRIIGGVRFYERKEIKDVIAYMSVLDNPFDFIRFRRIVNEPKRTIGDVTQIEIENASNELGISPFDVMATADQFPSLCKKVGVLKEFASVFGELTEISNDKSKNLPDLIDSVVNLTGYKAMLQKQGEEGAERLQNIDELKSAALKFAEENPESGLSDFLGQVALASDMDDYEQGEDRVSLMTIHSAKGLEFERVFLIGAEENLFPSFRSVANPMDLEEERRLMYVAITRAKTILHIITAKERLLFGMTQRNGISRFIKEIPADHIQINDRTRRVIATSSNNTSSSDLRTLEKSSTHSSHSRPRTRIESTRSTPSQLGLTFTEGECVNHKVFGKGTVLSVSDMGNDSLLEIAFDKVGTKKIMANFAKITKV
ncbi:MAG: UvrD-helicase domain-containing protein [Oscillospiraceae bacterium]|nr:UvrD-helicase domain-containing protein [Oscillospiraceae bacterium]